MSGAEIQAVGRLLASDQLLGHWVSALAAHRIIPELLGLLISGLSPRDSDLISLSCSLGTEIFAPQSGFHREAVSASPGSLLQIRISIPTPALLTPSLLSRCGPPSLRSMFYSLPPQADGSECHLKMEVV